MVSSEAADKAPFSFLARSPLVDYLVCVYLGITALLIAPAIGGGGEVARTFVVHLVIIAAVVGVRQLLVRVDDARLKALRLVHALYPWALIGLTWGELNTIIPAVTQGFYDETVLVLERAVFGPDFARGLVDTVNNLWFSEYMHFSYFSYYLMAPALALPLFLQRRYRTYRAYLFTILSAYFVCFTWFIFFPVEGPVFRFPRPEGVVTTGPFYRLTNWIVGKGSSRGATFPSSHVTSGITTVICAFRWCRPVFWVLLPVGIGLTVATVYGRFHYAIDAVGGMLLAALVSWLAPLIHGRLLARYVACADGGRSV